MLIFSLPTSPFQATDFLPLEKPESSLSTQKIPILLCSIPCNRPKLPGHRHPFRAGNTGKAWGSPSFLALEHKLNPEIPPLPKNPDLLCSVHRLLLLWGQIAWVLARELSSSMPPAFPLSAALVLAGELWTISSGEWLHTIQDKQMPHSLSMNRHGLLRFRCATLISNHN
ncbi:hypothetical protein SLEP1_g22693 [Rubroshorea leprosula]|uniref:Uncharacterized protein n=1 Tax=Rubroshorea leprosula TaxID=152421 RepID=A0AAV5JIS5_9ROSI|nr:hypothetical protein SLEP1_g22693 [Rubroshorea leprosula]